MAPLAGIAVLVTRPQGQAEAWLRGLVHAGARVFHQPGLEIRAADSDEPSLQRLDSLPANACAVFTSVPAVDAALKLQPELRSLDCWAVGRQTARRLIEHGCRCVLAPESGAGAEALLADDRFPGRQQVLIACARGGRRILADRLLAAGHQVHPVYVYERRPAQPVAGLADALAGCELPLVMVATSRAILERVHDLLASAVPLVEKPLVVISPRLADRARELGYGHVIIAQQPGLDSVLTAIGIAVGRIPDQRG